MADQNGHTDLGPPIEVAAPPSPIYACTLTPELVAEAREELEKPEWRLRDVQALRDMILKDHPDLRTWLDNAFLLRFLRARKFDYYWAHQLLFNYHASRKAWPEVFQGLKPSTVKHVLDLGFLTVLPRPDPHGRYILCLQPGKWPNDYPFVDNIRAISLTLEKLIQLEEPQVNGIVFLVDYTGVGLSQASNPGPLLEKKVVCIFQDGFPIRIKAVNIINEPRIFKGIFGIIKPFLKEKMAERDISNTIIFDTSLSPPNNMSCTAQFWLLSIESFLNLYCLKSMEEWLEDLTCLPGPERRWRLRKSLWWSSVSLILWRASFCQIPCCLRESKQAHIERTPSDIYIPSSITVTDFLATCNCFI